MSNENNKMQVDIDTLFKQNVNDLSSIKELYKRIEELGEKITQIKYIDNTLVKKLKKEYEKLQKIILDENIQVKLTNDVETINSQLEHTEKQISNYINVSTFNVKGDGVTDDTVNLQKAIDYAKDNNIYNVQFPNGVFKTTSTLYIPTGIELSSSGKAKNSTVIYYEGDSGFAIATHGSFGEHRRTKIDGIGVYVKSTTARGGILIGSEEDDSIIPVQHILDNIEIQDLSSGQIGIWLKNASGISMTQVLCNRGTGGTGLLISANGNNTGVMNFNNCSFGGHDQNDVGVELRHGTGGLDGFSFNGCYFGGKKPFLISGTSVVKNISINGVHIETTSSDNGEYYAFDINSVVGLTINSITLYGKRDVNFCGFIFRGTCRNVVIQGVDCNEFSGGTLYKYEGDNNNFTNSLLFEGTPTGVERNVVQTLGDFTNVTLLSSDGKLITNKVYANRIESTDLVSGARLKASDTIILGSSNNKIKYSSTKPTSDIARGNFYINQNPSELGNTGSKYVVIGWIGIGTNEVKECRCLTGN